MTSHAAPSWLRPMHRQDRQITDQNLVWEILRAADVCRVAFCSEGWPYIVPMNFGIHDGKLYFHCATEGTKLDLLKVNANVCFEVEANVEIRQGEQACEWSTSFQSVVGFGHMMIVTSEEERREAIEALVAQYTDRIVPVPEKIPANTIILRMDIESLTGKRSARD